jgi:uncharacterized membrane protein
MPTPGLLELIVIVAIIAILVALPVLLIVVIARRVRPTVVAPPPVRDPALDALRSRLAAGEIDEAEYQRLRSVLQGG